MSGRDFSHRERKKQKKDNKKLTPIAILKPPAEVEVIKKARKEPKEEEE